MPDLHLTPLVTAVAALAGAAVMITWRYRETSRPVSIAKILAPPLGMSTGLSMFVLPAARIPLAWAAAAFLGGALVLFIPMARSSKLVREGQVVLMQRSKAFLLILLGLVAVRLALKSYLEQWVSPLQTGAIFFLLAFGAVVRWRVAMFFHYRRLVFGEGPAADPRLAASRGG